MNSPTVNRDYGERGNPSAYRGEYGGDAQVLAHALCAQIDHAASMPKARTWVVRLPNVDPDAALLLRFSPPEALGRVVVECMLALGGVPMRTADYLSAEALRATRYRRTISLSLTKKASRLAEEIKGRLVPGYIEVLERIRAQRGAQGVACADYGQVGAGGYHMARPVHGFIMPTLLASIGLHSTEWTGHRSVVLPRLVTGGPQIDVKVESEQAGTVHLSISELPLERAQAVLQLICDLR
ncbi:hypothetical protein [Paraburkholderia bannensis]|uniref:hypothetical protein n=1 Tax=Paraburkholderia bannensis TaxID=765414 RepID=UPI002ABE1DB7|nr:hypothetical protein [Paraburkholderia bannensis]